jgi:hypothetical protein
MSPTRADVLGVQAGWTNRDEGATIRGGLDRLRRRFSQNQMRSRKPPRKLDHSSQRAFEGPTCKVACDGYLESYHHCVEHTITVSPYTMGNLVVHDPFGVHQRMVFGRRSLEEPNGVPEAQWQPDLHIRRIFHVFPNLAVSAMKGGHLINQIFPGATQAKSITGQTIMVREKPVADAQKREDHEFAEVTNGAIREEAHPTNEGVSQSLMSGRATGVVFGRNELALQYHRTLQSVMGEKP